MAEQALTVYVKDSLPIPVGCTPKQVRLAELALRFDPTTDTLTDICKQAGYADGTATATARRTLNSAGVIRAKEAIQRVQADTARGIMGLSKLALEKGAAKLDSLSPQDQLGFGLKAAELATNLGENIEQTGSGDDWHRRIRRMYYLAVKLTEARLLLPPPLQAAAAARHAARQAQRR